MAARTGSATQHAAQDDFDLPLFAAAAARPRPSGPREARRDRGRVAHLGGLAAEDQVARHYVDSGRTVRARRWRGAGGEIDIVAEDGDGLIFVEVKSAATHDRALESLQPRQVARLHAAAEEYLGSEPRGGLTPCRIDVALVDSLGRLSVLENLGH